MDRVSITLTQEEIIQLTMIVTDRDKDEGLRFLKSLELKVKRAQGSHCKPPV